MWSASHWDRALGPVKVVGRSLVVLRIILIAREMAAISVLMLVTRMPAGEPLIMEGVRPSSEQTTPRPPPPRGEGRGQAEPSVTMTVSPWRTALLTRSVACARAICFWAVERVEAEPSVGLSRGVGTLVGKGMKEGSGDQGQEGSGRRGVG